GPLITLPVTEGIEYTVEGDIAPGESVTVWANPTDNHHVIIVEPGSDGSATVTLRHPRSTSNGTDDGQLPTLGRTTTGQHRRGRDGWSVMQRRDDGQIDDIPSTSRE